MTSVDCGGEDEVTGEAQPTVLGPTVGGLW